MYVSKAHDLKRTLSAFLVFYLPLAPDRFGALMRNADNPELSVDSDPV